MSVRKWWVFCSGGTWPIIIGFSHLSGDRHLGNIGTRSEVLGLFLWDSTVNDDIGSVTFLLSAVVVVVMRFISGRQYLLELVRWP